ncbi:hypothetical protein C8R45DRAFT_1090546 [Mycena sanguinolenta]|nr:hypothetical protein C8R45DRAFT_1090546 [Mycena sanguinolenta]
MLTVPRIDLGTPSRRDSHAMSTISQTGSTRHILGPPASPAPSSFLSISNGTGKKDRPTSPAGSTHSHTLNYLPSKADTARMPSEGDEDYDGVDVRRHSLFPPLSALTQRKLRWTRFKSILFLANLVLSIYTLTALVFVILTYLGTLPSSSVVLAANGTELALSALAASVLVFTAALGWGGALLNNLGILAVFSLLLWVSFGLMVVPRPFVEATVRFLPPYPFPWFPLLLPSGALFLRSLASRNLVFLAAYISALSFGGDPAPSCIHPATPAFSCLPTCTASPGSQLRLAFMLTRQVGVALFLPNRLWFNSLGYVYIV